MSSRTALVQWYLDREGRVIYSSKERSGPKSYDSASAMFSALIAGKFLPKLTPLGSMSLLHKLDKILLHEIDREEIQRGDIFICGMINHKLLDNAYCGVVLSCDTVIFCSEEENGIARENLRHLPHHKVTWYRLIEPIDIDFNPFKRKNGRRVYI